MKLKWNIKSVTDTNNYKSDVITLINNIHHNKFISDLCKFLGISGSGKEVTFKDLEANAREHANVFCDINVRETMR